MGRNTFLIAMLMTILVLGAVFALQNNSTVTPASDESTRIEAPGTTVQTDSDGTRVQAPGVDITVPKQDDEK